MIFRVALLITLSLITNFSFAQVSNNLDVAKINQSSMSLTSYFGSFEDTSQALKIEDVQKISSQFQTDIQAKASINLSYSRSAYWLRLVVDNSSDNSIEKILSIDHPLLASIDFYWQIGNQNHQTINTGYARPLENRAYKSRIFAFPIKIQAHSQNIIYLKISSPNAIVIPAVLWEPIAFYQNERDDYTFQAIYLGLVIAMAMFCLVLALTLREFDYFLYVGMIVLVGLSVIAYRGLGAEYIWQNTPWLTQTGPLLFGTLTLGVELLFIRRMLETLTLLPKLDPVLKILIGFHFLIALLLCWTFAIAKYVVMTFAITSAIVLIVLFWGALKKNRNAYYLCAGFSILAISIIINLLHVFAVFPTNFYTVNSIQIGSALELLIFTLLLTDRYQIIQLDKQSKEVELINEKFERHEAELLKQIYFEHHYALDKAAIFVETDAQGVITFVNEHFCRISGYSKEELIGATHSLLKSDIHPPEFYGKLWKTIRSGNVWCDEICNKHKNGTLYWVNTVIVPIMDSVSPPRTKLKKYISIRFDITDRKEAEQRQLLLTNQVNQMQKVESLSRLTSGIAHDFNNLLGAIIGYNQLNSYAGEDCTDEKLKEEILFNTEQVQLASERAVNLIKKMMSYSRQNTVNEEIDVKPTHEVIEEVQVLMRPALTSKYQLNAELDSTLTVKIDSNQLHQILTNLIVNARDAMQLGGDITIFLNKVTQCHFVCNSCAQTLEGEFIELSVSDNGTGIEQEVIARIFDPFFTTKPVGEGTGLGLSTVSGMVHEALGHIIIESSTAAAHSGTTFRLLFSSD
jgi:PAS domain S-box-containing protein